MKQFIGLVIGLLVGVVGAVLFEQSLPPQEGSMEEKLEVMGMDLRRSERRVAELEADGRGRRGGSTMADRMREIAERLRAGEEISVDDIYMMFKDPLRDLSPLFARMRQVEVEDRFDAIAGEYMRTYELSERDQKELKQWLQMRAEEESRELERVLQDDSSRFVDLALAMRDGWETTAGLDEFMETRLQGEDLAKFKEERLLERIDSVQHEANRRLHRLDQVVGLEEEQKDEVFALMARSSRRYKPGMDFDGMGGDNSQLEGRARREAIQQVLGPDQLQRWQVHEAERRMEAERDMRRVGLTLPADWQLLDDENW